MWYKPGSSLITINIFLQDILLHMKYGYWLLLTQPFFTATTWTLQACPFTYSPNSYDWLTLTQQLLILRADLQETTIANAEIAWFTDASSLKNGKGEYRAGYAVTSSLEAIEAALLMTATLAQHKKFSALSRACVLAEGETVNIYSDSHYVSEGSSWLWHALESEGSRGKLDQEWKLGRFNFHLF